MSTLYVTTHGATIRKRGERLIVESPEDEELGELELRHLDGVVVLSTVQITTQAIVELLEHGVEVSILRPSGELVGQVTPPLGRNIGLRKNQFRCETDPHFVLRMAKQIVQAKVHNQRQVLMRFSQDEPGHQPASAEGIRQINDLYPRVESACDLDAVRGLEGACARAYWQGFAEMLKAEGVGFSHRQYHPSPDPVNAALSLGYALMTSMLHSLLDAAGFDPFLGFFHVEAYGRPSLALDLLEPLRSPIIDRLVVRLFNLRMLKLLDFEEDGEGGVQLTSKGFRVFFGEYEKQLAREDVRAQVRGQIEQLRRVYCDQADRLEPYLWRAR